MSKKVSIDDFMAEVKILAAQMEVMGQAKYFKILDNAVHACMPGEIYDPIRWVCKELNKSKDIDLPTPTQKLVQSILKYLD